MNRTILNQLKRAIKSNLEGNASHILELYGNYLSRKDIALLVRFMIRYRTYSIPIVRYICCISQHRHELGKDIRASMYIMLRHAGQEGSMDLIEILLSSIQAELYAGRYEYNRDLDITIECIMRCCDSNIIISLLEYSQAEPQYIRNKIDLAMEQACITEYADVILFMLEDEQISRHITPNLYASALKISSTRSGCLIVRILLKHLDRFVPESIRSICIGKALVSACSAGIPETVRCFLEDPRIDLAYDRNAAIYNACAYDNPAIVRLLLDDDRVDPTQGGLAGTMYAYAAGKYEIIKMLIDDGRADPSSNNNKTLIDAITDCVGREQMDIIRLLLTDRRVVSAGLTDAIKLAKFYGSRHDIIDILEAAQLESENIETKSGSANGSL